MATDFQPTQFQPVTVYDLPHLAFSQAIEGEATRAGLLSTVSETTGLGSATITPTERDGVIDKYKKQIGATSGLTGAMVDIATNPWVWLAFLTTPAAASAIKAGGRAAVGGVFTTAPKYHAFVRENAPFLAGWRFFTGNQAFRNTAALDAAKEVATVRQAELLRYRETVGVVEQQVIGRLRERGINVRSLDPDKAPRKHRDYIKRLDAAIHGRLQGMDEKVERIVSVVEDKPGTYEMSGVQMQASSIDEAFDRFESLKTPGFVYDTSKLNTIEKAETVLTDKVEMVEAIMDADTVSRVIDEAGAGSLVNAYRSYYDDTAVKMFLKEDQLAGKTSAELREIMSSREAVKEFIDEDKVVNLWRSQEVRAGDEAQDLFSLQPNKSDNPGIRLVQETMDLVRKNVTATNLNTMPNLDARTSGIIKRVFSNNIGSGFYHPRLYDSVDRMGNSLVQTARRNTGKKINDRAIAASQTMPETSESAFRTYSTEDLDVIESLGGTNADVIKQHERLRARLNNTVERIREVGDTATVSRLGAFNSGKFYSNNAASTYALYLHGSEVVARDAAGKAVRQYTNAWDGVTQTQKNSGRFYDATEASKEAGNRKLYGTATTKARNRDVLTEIEGPYGGTRGFYNMADVLNQVDGSIANPHLQGILRDTVVPQMLGKATVRGSTENLLVHTTAMAAKETADFLKKIKVDETAFGAGVVKSLDDFATKPQSFIGAGERGGIAKYLYMTHLGFNPAAVVLNLTQPWLLGASWMGVGPTIKAYGQAFKEMGGYIADRVAMGKLNIDDATKIALIKKHFQHSESLGIGPDVIQTLDNVAFPVGSLSQRKTLGERFTDTSMKLFEKGEWMNRLVTAHATDNLYKSAGKYATTGPMQAQRLRDVRQMIQETQFGADFLNTPMVFMGYGRLGSIFGAPEMRQFLSFPLRSVTGLAITSKQINEGRRAVLGFETGFAGARVTDFVRGMGVSASLYYAGRNMFEADMSKGLFYNSTTDIIGGDSFNSQESPTDFIPVPPFIDLGYDFAYGLIQADNELIANSIWRLTPGGIALSRAVSSLGPGFGLPRDTEMGRLAQTFQRKYADYSMKTPTGEVPVFKGDGTFVEFRNPMQMIMQGLGLDLNKSKVRSEETGYYIKQRDLILNYRKQILSRMIANDVAGAMRKKAEYEKRFGIPFTVTKAQIKGFMTNRLIPRDERILDRIPPKARHLYAGYVAADQTNKDVDPAAFVSAGTSTARSELMGRPQTFDLDPNSVKALKELMEKEESTGHQKSLSFTEYVPYGFQ